VHRIGRTGRAGLSGKAIAFCEREELPFLKDIQKLIGKQVPIVKDHPYATEYANVRAEALKPAGNSGHRNGRRPFAGRRS
jgi:ATP-dependent RNA helicase RhlE